METIKEYGIFGGRGNGDKFVTYASSPSCMTSKMTPRRKSSSSEADSFSHSQNILHSLWNTKVHYRVHNSPPLLRNLNQIKALPTLPTIYFFEIRFNIIIIYTSRSFNLSNVYPPKPYVQLPLTPTFYIPNPSHSSWNYHFLVILSLCTLTLGVGSSHKEQ